MNVRASAAVLSENELHRIERAAMRILAETGLNLQHMAMLDEMGEHGWKVDRKNERVYFQQEKLEAFLEESEPLDWDNLPPLRIQGGAYCSRYLPAGSDEPKIATVKNSIIMTRLGDYLDNIDVMIGMGIPSDVPQKVVPLWQYFIAWRYAQKTVSNAGGIFNEECLPYMEEMGQVMAAEKGGKAWNHVHVGLELISPLTFGKYEANMFYNTVKKGMRTTLMSIPSLGGTAPVTLAGALALGLAEIWLCNILMRVFTGKKSLNYMSSISPLDMRKGFMRLGRPENALLHVAVGQLAKRRRAEFHANCFLCDAHRPSVEAGFQKAITAIPAFMAGSISTGGVGMLSIDEYNSPIQLILDNEFAGALKRMLRGFEINDETLSVDLINRAGPGGNYLNEEHTFEHYREELWMPNIWTGSINNGWESGGRKLDLDYARDIYEDVMANYHPRGISEKAEEELMRIIRRAERDLA